MASNIIERAGGGFFAVGNDFTLSGSQNNNPVYISLADLNGGVTDTFSQQGGSTPQWNYSGPNYGYNISLNGKVSHTYSDANNAISISVDHEHTDSVQVYQYNPNQVPDLYIDNEGTFDNRTLVSTHDGSRGGSGTDLEYSIRNRPDPNTSYAGSPYDGSVCVQETFSLEISRQRQHFDRQAGLVYSDALLSVSMNPSSNTQGITIRPTGNNSHYYNISSSVNGSGLTATTYTNPDGSSYNAYTSRTMGSFDDWDSELVSVTYTFGVSSSNYSAQNLNTTNSTISYNDYLYTAQDAGHTPPGSQISGFAPGTASQSAYFKWSVKISIPDN